MRQGLSAPDRVLAEWQREMRWAYRGASYGQCASGLVWGAAAGVATLGYVRAAVWVLVFGGMMIYPATLLLMRLDGRHVPSARSNPLQRLGAQVALVLPLGMPVLLPIVGRGRIEAVFPAMLVLVGAHYLPFVFLYGMRAFLLLCAVLVMGGTVFLLGVGSVGFSPAIAGWFGSVTLLTWAIVGRLLVDGERLPA